MKNCAILAPTDGLLVIIFCVTKLLIKGAIIIIARKPTRRGLSLLPLNFFSTFVGYIYEAYDSNLHMNVALKMEKKDKSKNILKFEYQVLQHLKGK